MANQQHDREDIVDWDGDAVQVQPSKLETFSCIISYVSHAYLLQLTFVRRYYTAQGRVSKKASATDYKFRFECPSVLPGEAYLDTLFTTGDYCPVNILKKELLESDQAMYLHK